MALNQNNFCRWGNVANDNPSFTDTASGWTFTDDSPIGDNEAAWTFFDPEVGVQDGGSESTKGLSIPTKIKKGYRYNINFEIKENFYGDSVFYIYFMAGDKKQLAGQVTIGGTGQVQYQFEVTANADYSKLLAACTAVSGSGISVFIYQLRVVEIGTCDYSLPLLKDDDLSIFGNVQFDDTDIPFSSLKLGLWKVNEGVYLYDIASLNQVVISGDIYAFYADSWNVPALPKGNYCFFLYYITGFSELNVYYWSNTFQKVSSANYTSLIKYNNAVNTLGYLYESAPSFYNEFRIDLWTGRPNYNENVKGHDTYEGDLIRVKSDIQRRVEFQTRFYDEGVHEAFFSMLGHSSIEIDGVFYKKGEEGYDITWSEDDDNKIGNGIINLLEVDYSAAIKTC